MIPRVLPFLVVAALAVPAASGVPIQAELEAGSVQAIGATATDAALAVLLQENTGPEDPPGRPGFTLHAERLRIETDHTDLYIRSELATHNDRPQTIERNYSDAVVAGVEHRDQYRFILTPLDGGALASAEESRCADLAPSPASEVMREDHVKVSRPNTVVDTHDALVWTACGDGRFTVQGDFLLRLWNWDAHLTTPGGENRTLQSGEQPATQDPTGTTPTVGSADEQYLHAYNATLTVPVLTGPYRLYLRDAETTAQGGFRFHNATGRLPLPGGLDLDRDDVFLQGTLEAQVTGLDVDRPLRTRLTGDAQGAVINGDAIAFAAPNGGVWSWPWTAASILLVLMAGAVVAWYGSTEIRFRHLAGRGAASWACRGRRRRGVVYADRAQRAAKKGHSRRTWLWASLALRRQKNRAALLDLRAEAKALLGRHSGALRDHASLHGILEDNRGRARNACLAARNAAQLDDTQATKVWMERAFELNDTVFLVESIDIAYDDLRSHGWFQHLLRQAEAQGQGVH